MIEFVPYQMLTWDEVAKLEEEHSIVHMKLLQTLDLLYLQKKEGRQFMPPVEVLQVIEIRNQLQMSMDKTAALLRSIDKYQNYSTLDTNITAETVLAVRLRDLQERNYQLDLKLTPLIEQDQLSRSKLTNERQRHQDLVDRLQDFNQPDKKKPQNNNHNIILISENETLQATNNALKQILTAFKMEVGN